MLALKEDGRRLRFLDIDKIDTIYFGYKEENGTGEKRYTGKDHFANSLAYFEKEGSLKKISYRKNYKHNKQRIEYQVNDDNLWDSLARKYLVEESQVI